MREALPNRRNQESVAFDYESQHWIMSVGRYEDGRLAEVFISSNKSTSGMAAMARDAAVLISIALQHGVPAEGLRRSLTRDESNAPMSIAGRLLDELCGAVS